MAHRTLKTVATIIVAVPAVLFGGLVAMVEEPPVALWVLFLGLVLAAVLVLAWRWPVPGGVLVALVGLVPEWGWFTDQLEGNVQTLVESIGSVSPLWLAIPAVISGVLFVAAGLMPSGRRR
jgi:hypothetical protein